MDDERADHRPKGPSASRVPSGRLSRFLQLSATAGQMAASSAAEKVRRVAARAEEELPHVLLTAQNARLLAARLSRLRGAAMKVGQMLSLEGDTMLPKEFAEALEILRSSAHRMPTSQVKEVLAKEYGRDWASRFRSVQLQPMASASIGQVHQAFSLDGEDLVLKVQYPGVAESIDSDVDNLRSLLTLARLVPGTVNLDEMTEVIKKELRAEVDYERELAQLVAYRDMVGDDPDFRLPRAYSEHSTKHILAMERVPGVPLLTWAKTASQAERDAVAVKLLRLLVRELFEFRLSQTDPNPANYLYDATRDQVVLLDFGAARAVPADVGFIYGNALRGLAERDRDLLRSVLSDLGVVDESLPEAREMIVDLALEASEVFEGGPYDFHATNLMTRLALRGRKLAQFHGKLATPPPEYIFFQRKLGGTFLLCRQLRARVDTRAVLCDAGLL